MKHLLNLRTPAIAVDVPKSFDEFQVAYPIAKCNKTSLLIGMKSASTLFEHCFLPEGEWKILGRADEIANDIDHLKTLLTAKELHANFFNWQSYCTENGLTNQLILIQEK